MIQANEAIEFLRNNFLGFAQFISKEVFGFVDDSKFLADFAEFYQDISTQLESGESVIATVSAPVQHGKTTKNLMWLAWMAGRTQGKIPLNYFCADDNLRRRASREFLHIVNSEAFELVFGKFFRKCASSDGIYTIPDGSDIGFRLCGGGHTGFPSSISIIDDPYKARADAFSPAKIKSVEEFFETDIFSRLTPASAVIVLHSRWHTKDLIGVIEKDPGRWDAKQFIRPAILEDGTALMPEWRPIEWLNKQKAALGNQMFAALYEQKPEESANSPFNIDTIPYGSPPKVPLKYYITVDPANSKSESADYTCIFVFAVDPSAKFYLVDGIRDRLNINERSTILRNLYHKYNVGWIGYERYGMQVDIDYIQAERAKEKLSQLPIIELGGRMSKEDRILRLVGLFNNGILTIPKSLPKRTLNNEEYDLSNIIIDELIDFPVGDHDDAIDALSRIIDIYTAKPSLPEKKIDPNSGLALRQAILRPKNIY